MARPNLFHAEIQDSLLRAGNRFGVDTRTLTGTTQLERGPNILFLDPGGAARTVKLWASPKAGDWAVIVNTADAAEVITVQTAAAGAISAGITPTQAEVAVVFYNGTVWMGFVAIAV